MSEAEGSPNLTVRSTEVLVDSLHHLAGQRDTPLLVALTGDLEDRGILADQVGDLEVDAFGGAQPGAGEEGNQRPVPHGPGQTGLGVLLGDRPNDGFQLRPEERRGHTVGDGGVDQVDGGVAHHVAFDDQPLAESSESRQHPSAAGGCVLQAGHLGHGPFDVLKTEVVDVQPPEGQQERIGLCPVTGGPGQIQLGLTGDLGDDHRPVGQVPAVGGFGLAGDAPPDGSPLIEPLLGEDRHFGEGNGALDRCLGSGPNFHKGDYCS